MSYCVKCGVELEEGAKKCALCDTEVIIPDSINEGKENEFTKAFSQRKEIPKGVKSKFAALIITVLMVIPSIICGVVNLFFREDGPWSAYVICSIALAWVIFVFPFIAKKKHPYIIWGFDTVAATLYTYVFFPLQRENIDHFHFVALPIIFVFSICVLMFIFWARKKPRHWSEVMIHILADGLAVCMIVGAICFVNKITVGLVICLIIMLSILTLIGFAAYCNKSKRMRKWLKKKLFV